MGSAARIVNAYLTAFASGDVETARALVADDFSFHGPLVRTDGRDAFFAGASGLIPLARRHRLLHLWEDADDVCSIYEFLTRTPAGAGTVVMSDWHTVEEGRLRAARLVFDTAEFRRLVPARPEATR